MKYILIFSVVYAVLDAYHDKQVIQKKNWHTIDAFIKLWVALAIGLFYYLPNFNTDWTSIIAACYVILCIRWWIFDIALNLLRGLKWYHTGHNFMDRFPSQQTHWYVKIFAAFMCFVLIHFFW